MRTYKTSGVKVKYVVAGRNFAHKGEIFNICSSLLIKYRTRQKMNVAHESFVRDLLRHHPAYSEIAGGVGIRSIHVDKVLRKFVVVGGDGARHEIDASEAIKKLPACVRA